MKRALNEPTKPYTDQPGLSRSSVFMQIVGLMLISMCLASCSGGNPTKNNTSKNSTNPTQSTPAQQPQGQGGTVPPDSPYGFTVYEQFRPATVTDLEGLHVNWIRYQLNWSKIEPAPGQYNWTQLDTAVSLANKNHIHIVFPLQGAPAWALSQTCAGQPLFPGATEMAGFASAVAQRYNNKSGHGYIDSYEVGNEEYDSFWNGNWDQSIACRQPGFYGSVLKAAYEVLKAASPDALVGMNSLWWVNSSHVHDYMEWLYQNKYGNYFDYANFHYYICNGDPDLPSGERPSLADEAAIIHQVMTQYGDGARPIWLTETGWNINSIDQAANCQITPQVQADYLTKATLTAMNTGTIRHIFWYTIDRGNDGMSLTQPGGILPGFTALQKLIQAYATWPRPATQPGE